MPAACVDTSTSIDVPLSGSLVIGLRSKARPWDPDTRLTGPSKLTSAVR